MMKMLTIALAAENFLLRRLYGNGLQRIKVVKMADGSKYVVHGMRAKCSEGSMENYINTDKGHGVVYQGQPVLNANDHVKDINLTHFGDCKSKLIFEEAKKQADEKYKAEEGDGFFDKLGKGIAKFTTKTVLNVKEAFSSNKCELDTPLPWLFTSRDHMIDGAPALTTESQCPCKFGGIITIVPEEEVAMESEQSMEAVPKEKTGNDIDLSKLKPEDVTREIAEWLIANPVNVFAAQHPYIMQGLTGVDVLGLFYAGGFVMDGDGVYHARQEWSLQSFEYSGYNDFYDTVFHYATSMNKAKFQFSDDDGNDYILWAWKGDYLNLGAGAEMGIYNRMVIDGTPINQVNGTKTEHWLVDQSLAMPMTLTLDYNGKEIISYDPKKVDPKIFDPLRKSTDKWWVTGFNPDYQDKEAGDLTATYTVDFSDKKDLYDDFYKKYGQGKDKDSRWTFDPKTNVAKFKFK